MRLSVLVSKIKLHLGSGGPFVHQPFNFLLPIVGNAIQRIANAMRHSSFPGTVVAGDIADITESVTLRGFMVPEISKSDACDFHSGNLFHPVPPNSTAVVR